MALYLVNEENVVSLIYKLAIRIISIVFKTLKINFKYFFSKTFFFQKKYYVSLQHVKHSTKIGFGVVNNLYLLYRLSFRLFSGSPIRE